MKPPLIGFATHHLMPQKQCGPGASELHHTLDPCESRDKIPALPVCKKYDRQIKAARPQFCDDGTNRLMLAAIARFPVDGDHLIEMRVILENHPVDLIGQHRDAGAGIGIPQSSKNWGCHH